jgi:DNA-binding transcriptional LysR family regulator
MIDMPFRNVAGQLDLQLLLALEALLRHRHLTRAADALGVTQPVMSKHLRRLRAVLQDPLFVRAAGGIAPTPRAEALAAPLAQILELTRTRLLPEPEFDGATSRREFILCVSDFGATVLLPALLTELFARAPGVRLRVLSSDEGFAERLGSGEADLLVGLADRIPESIRTSVLYTDPYACLVRRDHPAAHDLNAERFANAQHVVVAPGSAGRNVAEIAIRERVPEARIVLRLPAFAAVPSVIASSDLVVTLPRRVAETIARGGEFAVLAPPFTLPDVTVLLAWHRRNDADPAHRWLRATIEGVLGRTPMRRRA